VGVLLAYTYIVAQSLGALQAVYAYVFRYIRVMSRHGAFWPTTPVRARPWRAVQNTPCWVERPVRPRNYIT
jgi:hypothetical protein